MNRVAEVNRELRLRGVAEKLTRGKGYYYFRDGEASTWFATSVYVFHSEQLSVETWLSEWSSLSGRPIPERIAARKADATALLDESSRRYEKEWGSIRRQGLRDNDD